MPTNAYADFPKLYEAFPGVKIRGGVSYFVWDRDHKGPYKVQTVWDGSTTGGEIARHLDAYDVLIRRDEAVPILEKVRIADERTLDKRISSQKPFGLASNYKGKPASTAMSSPVKLFANQKTLWIERSQIPQNAEWVDQWKVLMTAVQGTSAAVETKFLSRPILAGPGTACTETYLVAGRFDNEREAQNYSQYLRSRFVRFLVSLRKPAQHALRDVYAFVPDLPTDHAWKDAELYKRYSLSEVDISFLESQVAEHDVMSDEQDGSGACD